MSHTHAGGTTTRTGVHARRLAWTLGLTGSFLLVEVAGALWTGSLALLADAGHMLTDAGGLALALFAVWLASKPPTAAKTYGYYRAEILGLAAFLFVRNDPGAWPLGPLGFWESMRYPEVVQHRIFVLLVVAFAVFEWTVRTGRVRSRRAAFVFPLLCGIGGALLLTHSHAMFNLKSEFLAEVSHMPLGILGVIVGWARWLELRLPPPQNRIPGRVWATSMILIGILLVFYREV